MGFATIGGGGAGPPFPFQAVLEGLEHQIRALWAEIAKLRAEIERLGALLKSRSD